jgi:3-deoxy-manno-octulosonate cytidylyltransferase (CMP-KDO synthetase)
MSKKVVAFVPARMGASRFPGKPMARILGMPMIEHVRRRVALAEVVDEVIVATCDQVIFDTVIDAGGRAVMTKTTHDRGTDRIAEAVEGVECDIAIIVQGDEPLFLPEVLADLITPFAKGDDVQVTNLLGIIRNDADWHDIDIVKTALDEEGRILYYSRLPIPYFRVNVPLRRLRQTGVSAFAPAFLRTYASLPAPALENAESVEFLRILCHGHRIHGVITEDITAGVDRPDDVGKIENILRNDPVQNALYRKIIS